MSPRQLSIVSPLGLGYGRVGSPGGSFAGIRAAAEQTRGDGAEGCAGAWARSPILVRLRDGGARARNGAAMVLSAATVAPAGAAIARAHPGQAGRRRGR